jgi:hypothetical protein
MVVALIALRGEALGGRLGGYGRPGLEQAFQNYVKGLNSVVRLQPAHREWQLLASIFATTLPVLALGLWRRATPGARYVLLAGIAMTLQFNLPFVFVSKIEQMHLVTLGSVLLLAGSGAGLVSSSRKPTVIAVSVLALAGGAAAMAAVASDISDDFAPFSPVVRYHDTIVKDWAAVPQELRDYLRQKLQPGAEAVVPPNPLEALTVVSWGLHPPERSPGGLEYRWMSGSRAEIHVSPRVQEVFIPIRHAAEAFREPATARIEVNGRRVDSLLMEDADWRTSRVRVGALRPPRLARFHRIVIAIDHAWIPALLHPRSNDHRTLGLQIGKLQLR